MDSRSRIFSGTANVAPSVANNTWKTTRVATRAVTTEPLAHRPGAASLPRNGGALYRLPPRRGGDCRRDQDRRDHSRIPDRRPGAGGRPSHPHVADRHRVLPHGRSRGADRDAPHRIAGNAAGPRNGDPGPWTRVATILLAIFVVVILAENRGDFRPPSRIL